jgi:hypothetical protein
MAEIDYSIRPLCYSHVDLPREFFGGVPIHSGEGVSTSPMVYVLVSGKEPDGTVHHYLVDAGFAGRQVDPPVLLLPLGGARGGAGQGRGRP